MLCPTIPIRSPDQKVHERLQTRGVRPLIEVRAMWKDELERPLPGHEQSATPLYYDEAGTVYCYDMVSKTPVRHPMAYVGYEKDRKCLKYRCPARQHNWRCPSERSSGERTTATSLVPIAFGRMSQR